LFDFAIRGYCPLKSPIIISCGSVVADNHQLITAKLGDELGAIYNEHKLIALSKEIHTVFDCRFVHVLKVR